MNISFHVDAEIELNEAIDFYSESSETAEDFIHEVYQATQRIKDFPKAWPLRRDGIRRTLLNRYPYAILYSLNGDRIFIWAVMHLHRHPDYWQSRLQ